MHACDRAYWELRMNTKLDAPLNISVNVTWIIIRVSIKSGATTSLINDKLFLSSFSIFANHPDWVFRGNTTRIKLLLTAFINNYLVRNRLDSARAHQSLTPFSIMTSRSRKCITASLSTGVLGLKSRTLSAATFWTDALTAVAVTVSIHR